MASAAWVLIDLAFTLRQRPPRDPRRHPSDGARRVAGRHNDGRAARPVDPRRRSVFPTVGKAHLGGTCGNGGRGGLTDQD